MPRMMSDGGYLKSEYHGISAGDSTRLSVMSTRGSPHVTDSALKMQERRFSKSKNFILKVIPGRSQSEPKSSNALHRLSSSVSRHTLFRRPSRPERDSSAYYADEDSIASSDIAYSLDNDSEDIADDDFNSRMPPYLDYLDSRASSPFSSLNPSPAIYHRDVFVLCPQIKVTPEISTVDGATCSIWAALEVTGVLRWTENHGSGAHRYLSLSGAQLSGMFDLRTRMFQPG
jgi:hypothetical protein